MKKFLKYTAKLSLVLIAIVIALACFLPIPAAAIDEEYGAVTAVSTPTLSGGTNNVAPATTNTYTSYWNLTQHDQATLYVSLKGNNASMTDNAKLNFALGPTSALKGTVAPGIFSVVLAADGTTASAYVTNLNMQTIGYLHLKSIENTNETYSLTNITISVYVKPIREGYRK